MLVNIIEVIGQLTEDDISTNYLGDGRQTDFLSVDVIDAYDAPKEIIDSIIEMVEDTFNRSVRSVNLAHHQVVLTLG